MPNFFMKPQEMADSMKALRIAANFRKSPRISHPSFATLSSTSDYSDEDPNAKNTAISKVTVPRNTKVSLQEQVREHLPVDASEMARIASIFASKILRFRCGLTLPWKEFRFEFKLDIKFN